MASFFVFLEINTMCYTARVAIKYIALISRDIGRTYEIKNHILPLCY